MYDYLECESKRLKVNDNNRDEDSAMGVRPPEHHKYGEILEEARVELIVSHEF